MYVAPKILVIAPSTFAYFQALCGAAEEVHYPSIGFLHSQHNVCMRQGSEGSHFGQIRLPFDDTRVVYHDLYSRKFFLTYAEYAEQEKHLPCWSILTQHLCPAGAFLKGNENSSAAERQKRGARYCYEDQNSITQAVAVQAPRNRTCEEHGGQLSALRTPNRNPRCKLGAPGIPGVPLVPLFF
eukprot:FR743300.1.p1 GENE.FR743300.1~~FR743300.1.p1  ORF type:complete len:183 (+),score=8.53 FR743300.1:427-975(+)